MTLVQLEDCLKAVGLVYPVSQPLQLDVICHQRESMIVLSTGVGKASGGAGRCFVWEVLALQPSSSLSDWLPSRVKGQGRQMSQSHLVKGRRSNRQLDLRPLYQLENISAGRFSSEITNTIRTPSLWGWGCVGVNKIPVLPLTLTRGSDQKTLAQGLPTQQAVLAWVPARCPLI